MTSWILIIGGVATAGTAIVVAPRGAARVAVVCGLGAAVVGFALLLAGMTVGAP